jgi:tetratricopeptide (TPR) repeat protein
MADCYSMLPITCDAPALEILPKALAAAWRAVELDERSAEAHTSVGTVKVWMDWDWRGAEIALRRALELNPSYVQAHRYYACLLSHTGRHDEAAAEMDRARALDPLSPIMHALSGHLRYHAGDYQGARAHLSDALAIKPDLWIVHTFLGRVYECQGHLDMAMAAFEKAFTLSGGGATEPIAFRARMEALSGNREAAEAALRMLQDVATRKYVPPYNIAMIYAGLGDWDSALDWLEKGLEERDVRLVFLKVEPRWNPLRDQRRFRNLLQRLQLENTGAVESGGY